ncbi:uncharacterized protein EDB93DRAFT_1117851 [Suillus bovinus]|uniref:uncharacterized protein n=1 Tax=Suillus bovinus TaxID=48563 RepID=UPI001B87E3EE|nr:uncharacterized protein EDB93DRAFT_1117851 [Suillus bovinus]KAG2159057.1 hypothetical protein EDB93DRAFT_1117851 [Suillus bovinus]
MFTRCQCLILPWPLFILVFKLHLLYFLMDTCIIHSLPSIIYIMHLATHTIIPFLIILFTIIIYLHKLHNHITIAIELIAHFYRVVQIVSCTIASDSATNGADTDTECEKAWRQTCDMV